MDFMADWPDWGTRLFWTAVTLGVAYAVGHVLNTFVSRLVRLAARTESQWDDIVIEEIKRRLPFWSLLVGAWYALGHWDIEGTSTYTLLRNAIVVIAGLSVTWTVATIVSRLIRAYSTGLSASAVPVSGLTQNVAKFLVMTLGILAVLNSLGVSIAPMLAALGVGGIAVALALQDPLSNLFAGLFTSMSGQLRIGDFIELEDGKAGYIVDIDWRSTRVRLLQNNVVIVPNNRLAQSIVTNYHLPELEMAVLVQVGVDYASDLGHVERVTIEVARDVLKTVQGGIVDFDPFIRYHTFGDSSIDFSVILRGKEFVDQFLLKHEFIKRLSARYDQEGITIPFPIRTLAPRDPIPVVTIQPKGQE
jgi:small-conductance mechanosensitive channel